MNVPNLDEIEDMEQYFSEVLELDMSNAYYDMKDIIEVIVELSRMQGQAIDRAQAGLINTAVEKAHDKWQTEKQKDNE